MSLSTIDRIRSKVIQIAKEQGNDASSLKSTDIIPETGFLDSAGILELIVWCEEEFRVELPPEEITIDNFGTIEAIAAFCEARARR